MLVSVHASVNAFETDTVTIACSLAKSDENWEMSIMDIAEAAFPFHPGR
jgi:hypothetical protein